MRYSWKTSIAYDELENTVCAAGKPLMSGKIAGPPAVTVPSDV